MLSISKKIVGYRVGTAVPQPPHPHFVGDADRRLAIKGVPTPATASLRWQKRPVLPQGNPSYTYVVHAPEGSFSVMVGHLANGTPLTGTPFEVWVNGAEAPRGLSDLARSLSIDLRSEDRAWLRRKLSALQKTPGLPFDLTLPNGNQVRAKGAVDAFAKLVEHRCQELGAFTDEKLANTPVMDALMSRREPKTTGDGSIGWYVDVENVQTGDEFVLLLKEAVLENGQRRPFSLWLSGDYPHSLDGLAKSLSLDMRVTDPGWLARKLNQLIDVREERGDFWAWVPGTEKQQNYPSTVAYVAALVQFRFKQLGLLDEAGQPVTDGVVVQLDDARGHREKGSSRLTGRDCSSCGAIGTVIRQEGCDCCKSCGHSKCN